MIRRNPEAAASGFLCLQSGRYFKTFFNHPEGETKIYNRNFITALFPNEYMGRRPYEFHGFRFNIKKGGVIVDCGSGGQAVKSIDVKVDGGFLYAYSKDKIAIQAYHTNTSFGKININDGTVVAITDSDSKNAIEAENGIIFGPYVEVVKPVGGAISGDKKTIMKGANRCPTVVIKGKNSRLSKDKYEVKIDSPEGKFDGDKALWNTLYMLYNRQIYGSMFRDDKYVDYDLNKEGGYDITASKTETGCLITPLPGGGHMASKDLEIDLTDDRIISKIIELENEADKEGTTGPLYYLFMNFDLPKFIDCGNMELNFVYGGGKEEIEEESDILRLTKTIDYAVSDGIIKTEGSFLSGLKMDIDKDGNFDLESVYDSVKKKTTITLLPGSSLKKDTTLSFSDEQKAAHTGAGEEYFSSISLVLESKKDKGEYVIDLSESGKEESYEVTIALGTAEKSGRITLDFIDSDNSNYDLDKDGNMDINVKRHTIDTDMITALPGNSIKGSFVLELTAEEKADLETMFYIEGYYSKVTFIFDKSSSHDPEKETEKDPETDPEKDPGSISNNTAEKIAQKTLNKTTSENAAVGEDKVTLSYNGFVRFDGRTHNVVGIGPDGKEGKHKDTKKKVYDVKVKVIWNGEIVDPKDYKVTTKNGKAASVSIDGINFIQTNEKKRPYYTVKFKGKNYKKANTEFKKLKIPFNIIPAEIKLDNVEAKTKKGKDGKLKLKKLTFKPASAGSVTLKPVKMKFNKKEEKTDYIINDNLDGTLTVTGKNNYFGSIKVSP